MSRPALNPEARILTAGDRALVIELGEGIDETVNRAVHALTLALDRQALAGVVDLVPTYRSLLVNYDPNRTTRAALAETIAGIARSGRDRAATTARRVEIPTCYGGEFGPDLALVAEHNGLTADQVVAIHTSNPCRVFMMGFSPGFAYMGGMSPRIATPRLKTPRTAIPAGSVGIAQEQTGIYPVESPGGWQLIGRTPLRLFDPGLTPPTLLQPGDLVQFVAIDRAEFQRLAAAPPVRPEPVEGRTRQTVDRQEHRAVIEVLDPGALTTVQDLGRYGYQRYGVPVSGAMDEFALRVANLLVGNDEGAAGLEMTITGPQLRFLEEAVVAVTGADMQPRLNDGAVPCWQPFPVPRDGVLSFRGLRAGARGYLAIAGGIGVPVVLGSRSTYIRSRLGGLDGRALGAGDVLACGPIAPSPGARRMPRSWRPLYLGSHRVRVMRGPQDVAFTPAGMQTLLGSAYVIGTQSDRMGYRLQGPPIEHRGGADIVSDGTPAGAIQVAGDGQPLVLLADRGTTGGYAKIATVIGADLPRLAQCRPGDRVFFDEVSAAEAHAAAAREQALIEEIRTGPRLAMDDPSTHARPDTVRSPAPTAGRTIARAPLPGRIVAIDVAPGDAVDRGQTLGVLEAMKMQNAIRSAQSGRVRAVLVAVGDQVADGQPLFEVEPEIGSR